MRVSFYGQRSKKKVLVQENGEVSNAAINVKHDEGTSGIGGNIEHWPDLTSVAFPTLGNLTNILGLSKSSLYRPELGLGVKTQPLIG